MKKRIRQTLIVLLVTYAIWVIACRQQIHISPNIAQKDLAYYVQKDIALKDKSYDLIYRQTGLTKAGMETLKKNNELGLLMAIQRHFFEEPKTMTERTNIFCHQEWIEECDTSPVFVAEDGDIIITLASYLGGWRYGHCGLILNAKEGKVLEAITYGQPSGIEDISHWKEYPAYVILRPKHITKQQKEDVIAYAYENLCGIRYDLLSFKTKHSKGPIKRTHCSHLIWYAYHSIGLDLDADGTAIVTPYDIVWDDDLEIVQVYGMDLDDKMRNK